MPERAGRYAGTATQPSARPCATARLGCWEAGVSRCDDAGGMGLGGVGRRQRVSGLARPSPRGFSAFGACQRVSARVSACVRRCHERRYSARDGVTEGGKGRSDGPLPLQAQHAADHTRPKSMWSRVTRRCSAFMRSIEQYISRLVNHGPDAGRSSSGSCAVDTGARWPHTIEDGPAPPRAAAAPAALRDAAIVMTPETGPPAWYPRRLCANSVNVCRRVVTGVRASPWRAF